MSQGVPRTHVESLYVRVTTSSGVAGWGESFGTARPMVVAAFDNWIRRLAVGQSASDEALVPRIERMLLSLSRSGPLAHALAGLDIALWDIRGKLAGVPVSTLLGGAKRTHVECYASLLQYSGNPEYIKRNTARALERGYRYVKLHERTAAAVAAAREVTGPDIPLMVDTNCAWTPAEAEAAVTAMAPYKPFWVEEPIYPGSLLGPGLAITHLSKRDPLGLICKSSAAMRCGTVAMRVVAVNKEGTIRKVLLAPRHRRAGPFCSGEDYLRQPCLPSSSRSADCYKPGFSQPLDVTYDTGS
jgi:hypothetical protein